MKTKRIAGNFFIVLIILIFSVSFASGQTLCGDVDGNGSVNIVDALMLSQCYVVLRDDCQIDISDIDCNANVNIVDALMIAQYYVGLRTSLYCCEETPTPTPEPPTPTPTPTPEPPTPTPTPTPEPPTPTPTAGVDSIHIEAEDYIAMSGVELETCSEGTQNVGYIDAGDWMDYNVNISQAGGYDIEFRYASESNGLSIALKKGSSILKNISAPSTGGWQNWASEIVSVSLEAGTQTLRLEATGNGWNLNYINFTYNGGPVPTPTPTPTSTPTPEPPTPTPTLTPEDTPTPTPTPTPEDINGLVKIHYRCGETNPIANQIRPLIIIRNEGTTAISLSELTVRYYYTKDGDADQAFHIDFAAIGAGNITGTFYNEYLELTFDPAAGDLGAGANTGEIQIRLNKTDWTPYDQSNDYSFDPTFLAFAEYQKITIHQSDVLIWGIEPVIIPTPTPTSFDPTTDLRIRYQCVETATDAANIQFWILIDNNGGNDVPYNELEIRYYLTKDDSRTQFRFACEQTPMGSQPLTLDQINAQFVNYFEYEHYLSITFINTSEVIPAGSSSGQEMKILIYYDLSETRDQSNDWSFDPAITTMTEYDRITIFRNDELVWGTEAELPTPSPTPEPTPTPTETPVPTETPEPTETPVPTETPTPTPEEGGQNIFLEAEDYLTAKDNTSSDNIGLRYRFGDGVDIEDNPDGGYNTGWTQGGEYLRWEVILDEAGLFNFWLRASSDWDYIPSGCPGNIIVNNAIQVGGALFYIPNTDIYDLPQWESNWQNFENFLIGQATLNSGVNTIMLQHAGSDSFDADFVYLTGGQDPPPARTPVPEPGGYQKPVDQHGQLQVIGIDLCDSTGTPVQLKGMSTHDIRWHWLAKGHTIQNAAYTLGIDLIRIAVYVDPNNKGYAQGNNGPLLKDRAIDYIEDAIATGIYVIVDWHVLKERDPITHKDLAKAFFNELSQTYGNYPNLIWEICNEPNSGPTWAQVKQYAEEVIPVIRANDPDNIIIVGSTTWSSDVDIASQDPVTGHTNLLYSLHFYAASHGQNYRDKGNTAMANGIGIFVTEFGTCDSSATGGNNFAESQVWMDWMAANNISWANWALCNKRETTSMFQEPVGLTGPWSDSNPPSQAWPASDFTAAGSWILEKLNE